MRKFAVLVFLMALLSINAFSEMTFGFNTSINFLNETYIEENYKRFLAGMGEQFRFEIYGKDSIVGFFAQDEIGFYSTNKQDTFLSFYVSMAAGPSFILRTSSKRIFASLSMGMMLQWYNEFYTVKENLNSGTWSAPRAYTAFDIGGMADLAIVLKTSGRFFGRFGITGEFVFFRSESGNSIRNANKIEFLGQGPYMGYVIKPHIGIGLGYLFD